MDFSGLIDKWQWQGNKPHTEGQRVTTSDNK